jgi:hypothetical protein
MNDFLTRAQVFPVEKIKTLTPPAITIAIPAYRVNGTIPTRNALPRRRASLSFDK